MATFSVDVQVVKNLIIEETIQSSSLPISFYGSSLILATFSSITGSNISTIIGGDSHQILGYCNYNSHILGGSCNIICLSNRSSIIGGSSSLIQNSTFSSIINSPNSSDFYSQNSTILGSKDSSIFNSNNTLIIGGTGSSMSCSNNSIILGGIGLTLSNEDNVVYVPELKISTVSNVNSNRILVWDENDNYVRYRDLSSISTTDPIDVNQIAFGVGLGITSSQSFIFENSNLNLVVASSSSIYNSTYDSIIGGSSHLIATQSNFASIIGGFCSIITCESSDSVIIGGRYSFICGSTGSIILGGDGTMTPTIGLTGGNKIYGGQNNLVTGGMFDGSMNLPNYICNSNASSIIGGYSNRIFGSYNNQASVIGGSLNLIYGTGSDNSSIIGGVANCIYECNRYSSLIGGQLNKLNYCNYWSTIIGGYLNNIYNCSSQSTIIGGQYNSLTASFASAIISASGSIITSSNNSVILGGQGLTLSSENDVVYVSQLKIATASIATATQSAKFLVLEDNNYVSYKEESTLNKAGYVLGSDFWSVTENSETKYVIFVTFSVATLDTNYSISVVGNDLKAWTVDNETINGFRIDSNDSFAKPSGRVYWQVQKIQDS